MRSLHEQSRIERLDLALSKVATGGPSYVQDAVEARSGEIADYLGKDGAVVICGAVAMGTAVERLLADALQDDWIEEARASHRWRSAIY
jgi:sulfite reductase alpha subunit-like flavoprotein